MAALALSVVRSCVEGLDGMSTIQPELARRQSLAAQLEALLRSKPGEWISIQELAQIGGIGGWRTRLSELSRRKVDPMHIAHNGKNGAASCHRYLPHEPLGRDATEPIADRWPIVGAPYAETFRLT